MLMTFYEKDKILSCEEPVRIMKSEYNPKPPIGEKIVILGVMYTVCDVITNYDEHQINVIVDRV